MNSYPFESRAIKKLKRPKKPLSYVEKKICIQHGNVEMTLPIYTVSEGNCFEAWQKKAKRHKDQKKFVAFNMRDCQINWPLPIHVSLTRLAPRLLDEHDNLRMSLKYILDGVAEEITKDYRPGRADNNPGLTWSYFQEKSKSYGIRIIFNWNSKG